MYPNSMVSRSPWGIPGRFTNIAKVPKLCRSGLGWNGRAARWTAATVPISPAFYFLCAKQPRLEGMGTEVLAWREYGVQEVCGASRRSSNPMRRLANSKALKA